MTHSHDTSTPAMSDETVPSEEFVLVPREPTPAMVDAGRIYGWDDPEHEASCIGHPETREAIYRAMIAAAPTLSASHLAKEGGEVWAAEPIGSFNEWFLSLPLERQAILRDDKWMLAEAAWAAGQLLPQPSPTLAKGGDAVREIAADLEQSASKLVGGSWGGLALEPVARAIAQDRGALSTPTEGPASAEDWLRGMARMSSYPVEICQKFEDLADLIVEHHNATA